jgi:hypothetical protein
MTTATTQDRRVVRGKGAYKYVVFVRPPATREPDQFEHTAIMSGYIGVIGGEVIKPGSPAAQAYQRSVEGAAVLSNMSVMRPVPNGTPTRHKQERL